jgi:hypothetical protein
MSGSDRRPERGQQSAILVGLEFAVLAGVYLAARPASVRHNSRTAAQEKHPRLALCKWIYATSS